LRDCLDARDGIGRTDRIPRASPDRVAGALAAVRFRTGGPREDDGTIIEAPLQINELSVLPDAAAAQRAAAAARRGLRAGGDSAEVIGRAVLVHRSVFIGDQPGGVAVSAAERAAARDCLEQTRFVQPSDG
jgi:hypothetical protein